MSERGLSRLWRCEPVVARVAAIAVLVVAAAGWVAIVGVARGFWERTATFSGPETAAPSRLYGRPLRLRGGEMMTPERLADLLALHGYARAIRIEPRAGQFREIAPGEFAIVRRASPFEPPDPRADRLAISIARGRVTRLVEGGAERAELALDPALLATWLGADRADRRPAAFDELPPHLVRAVLAAEDARFFDHDGLALEGIVRAALVNLRAGEIRQGASTITQQLVRLRYLDPRRTWSRKLREAALATALEWRSTKPEILTSYLNEIYFGRSGDAELLGVGAAAWALFGKSPSRLELHWI